MKDLKIKICGLTQAANVEAVARLRPDYMGFIFYDKSPRYISPISAELIKFVPSSIKTVGVFVNEKLEVILNLVKEHQLKAIQLHGSESPEFCKKLKEQNVVEVIKAFGLNAEFDFKILNTYLGTIDYFLFDTQTPKHGGSGKKFDWTLLQQYNLEVPYFLSGGIGLEHAELISKINDTRIHAVDVNSRFEIQPGLKNVDELEDFFEKLNK